jgi:hypothetical protein
LLFFPSAIFDREHAMSFWDMFRHIWATHLIMETSTNIQCRTSVTPAWILASHLNVFTFYVVLDSDRGWLGNPNSSGSVVPAGGCASGPPLRRLPSTSDRRSVHAHSGKGILARDDLEKTGQSSKKLDDAIFNSFKLKGGQR